MASTDGRSITREVLSAGAGIAAAAALGLAPNALGVVPNSAAEATTELGTQAGLVDAGKGVGHVASSGMHLETATRRRGSPFCTPKGTLLYIPDSETGTFVPVPGPGGEQRDVNNVKQVQVSGQRVAPTPGMGWGIRILNGKNAGKYAFTLAQPIPIYPGKCKPSDIKPSPNSGGSAPTPGRERFPGDEPETSGAGSTVVTDENNDGVISYMGKILFRPVCDDDTGPNPATVEGFAAFGKGVPVLGVKANIIGRGYTTSLFGQVDALAWQPIDTTNQITVPLPVTNLYKPDGAEFRLTARISTNLGAVNIILRQPADECLQRDDGGSSPVSEDDPDIGGEAIG